MVSCLQCGKELIPGEGKDWIISISGSIMGDEYTDSFYLCSNCNVFTVEVCHDPFLGEKQISSRGPVSREEGDAAIALIRRCSEPWDKKCRCETHRAYFEGQLD